MRWPRRSTATTRPSSSGALPRAAGRGGPSKTSSWRPSAGSTGTTWPGCTATCATFPPPSTKQRSTMPYGSTSPWSKPNSPSLHHSQGGSTPPRHACTQQSSRPAAATSPTRSTTCSLSPGCSAACWTRALVTSTCRWKQRQRRHSPTCSSQANSTHPSSCPASSTWTCRKQWRKRYSARSAPNLDQLLASTITHPRRSTIWASAFGLTGRAG